MPLPADPAPRPATLEHSSILAGRLYYALRRAGHARDVAHILAEQSAHGRPVARILAHAKRCPA